MLKRIIIVLIAILAIIFLPYLLGEIYGILIFNHISNQTAIHNPTIAWICGFTTTIIIGGAVVGIYRIGEYIIHG